MTEGYPEPYVMLTPEQLKQMIHTMASEIRELRESNLRMSDVMQNVRLQLGIGEEDSILQAIGVLTDLVAEVYGPVDSATSVKDE